MQDAKKNEGRIVKMQANVRGFLSRKANKQSNDFVDPKPLLSKRSNSKMPGGHLLGDKGRPLLHGNSYARELKEMPDHSNEFTRATESKLDPFVYDKDEDPLND